MNTQDGTSSGKEKQGFAIAGLVCGIIAFGVLPVILGPLGIVLGGISWKAGNKLGAAATIVAIVGTVVGMLIGAAMWSS